MNDQVSTPNEDPKERDDPEKEQTASSHTPPDVDAHAGPLPGQNTPADIPTLTIDDIVFRSLVEDNPDIIARFDRQRRFVYLNNAITAFTNRSRAEFIGKSLAELGIDSRLSPPVTPVFERAFTTGQSETVEYTYPTPTGIRVFHTLIIPERGNSGSIETVLALARDITERKRAEEDLNEYARKLERSNQELEQFAFTASHDLQEPLRKVRAFAEQIQVKYGSVIGEEGQEFIRRMIAAVRRMEEMIHSLLAYSRITTKTQPFTSVDLNTIVQLVLVDLDVRLDQTGGRVEVGELPEIKADPMQLRQLMQNLIGNALKFHRPKDPPVVNIISRIISLRGRDWVEIQVTDNGIGFDEKYKDLVFQPFQRLHGRSEYEGSGMGLAICRKIVERHGGEITLRSKPGTGTTISILLPVEPPK